MHEISNIRLTGNTMVASQYYWEAGYVRDLLAMQKTDVAYQTINLKDGSFVSGVKIKDQYNILIFGASPNVTTTEKRMYQHEYTSIVSGLVTDPSTVWIEFVSHASEFTHCKSSYKPKVGVPRARNISKEVGEIGGSKFYDRYNAGVQTILDNAPTAVNTPALLLDYKKARALYPITQASQLQVAKLVPSMFSGELRRVVQLVLGVNSTEAEVGVVEYGCFFHSTQALLKTPKNQYWMISIDALGVRLGAMPVLDDKKLQIPEVQRYGGYPSGKLPAGYIQILEPEILEPYFECIPVTDEFQGWVTNDEGTQYFNTGIYVDSNGDWYSRLFSITITVDEYNQGTAEFKVERESRVGIPTAWQMHYGRFMVRGSDVIYNTPSMAAGFDEAEGTRGWSSNNDTSWNITHVPFAFPIYSFDSESYGVTMGRVMYLFPPSINIVEDIHEIDATLFVVFQKGEFHFINYCWNLAFAGFGEQPQGGFTNSRFLKGYGITYSKIAGVSGIPPTMYTNVYDRRRASYAEEHINLPLGGLFNALNSKSVTYEPNWGPTPTDRFYYDSTTIHDYLNHVEIRLLFMSRSDYILIDKNCLGKNYGYFPPEGSISITTETTPVGELTTISVDQNEKNQLEAFGLISFQSDSHPMSLGDYSSVPPILGHETEVFFWDPARNGYLVRPIGAGMNAWWGDTPDKNPPNSLNIPISGDVPTLELNSASTHFESSIASTFMHDAFMSGGRYYYVNAHVMDSVLGPSFWYIGDRACFISRNPDIRTNIIALGAVEGEEDNIVSGVDDHRFDEAADPDQHYPWEFFDKTEFVMGCLICPDQTQVRLYVGGFPDDYKFPKVNRITLDRYNFCGATIIRGPEAGASYVGENFGFVIIRHPSVDGQTDHEILSFGSVPGGLVLDATDMICPVGKMENG